jgi:hypothetical protein
LGTATPFFTPASNVKKRELIAAPIIVDMRTEAPSLAIARPMGRLIAETPPPNTRARVSSTLSSLPAKTASTSKSPCPIPSTLPVRSAPPATAICRIRAGISQPPRRLLVVLRLGTRISISNTSPFCTPGGK